MKQALLGMAGLFGVGLTLSGCADCCGSRCCGNGRKFQPAPLVQRNPAPAAPTAAAGFNTTPRSMQTPMAAQTPAGMPATLPAGLDNGRSPTITPAVASEAATATKPVIQPVSGVAPAIDPDMVTPGPLPGSLPGSTPLPPPPTGGNLSTVRKTTGLDDLPQAPQPPPLPRPALPSSAPLPLKPPPSGMPAADLVEPPPFKSSYNKDLPDSIPNTK
jgi:hypothetical protein